MPMDSSPLLIHLHIPKNAGTTLGRTLRFGFMLRPLHHLLNHRIVLGYHNLLNYELRLKRIAALSEPSRRRIRLFEAHAGYGLHEHIPSPSAYITMLREPIDRVLSIYFFHRSRGRIAESTSLGEFVQGYDPGRLWWIDNAQVRYLAGEGGRILDCPAGEVNRSHLELAKQRLERDFFFFGLVEQFDLSMNLLRRRLGWKRFYYSTSNVTQQRRSINQMPRDDIDLVRQQNALDLELYAHATSLFDQAVARDGPPIHEELERFRAANRLYNRTFGRLYWLVSVTRPMRRGVWPMKSRRADADEQS